MAAKLDNFVHDARVYLASLRLQFRAAAALRGAFLMQIIGMIINNIGLVAAWLFFFDRFGTINGWSAPEFVAMQGMSMLVFGAMIFSNTGLMDLPRHVDTGSFDGFLTKPTSVLGQLSSSNIDISSLGDILLGVALVIWYMIYSDPSLMAIGLFMLSLFAALAVFWSFAVLLPFVLAFYVFDSERLSRTIGAIFLDGTVYPGGILTGAMRTFFLIMVPALLVGVVPVDVLRGLNWEWVLFGAVVAGFWLRFSLWLFKRSLRKYESANLVGAR